MKTIEDFEHQVNEKADEFIEATRIWTNSIMSLVTTAIEADLPEHLIAASLNETSERVQNEAEKIQQKVTK